MSKPEPQLDVLVLGDHPAAYLAAALLRNKTKLRVLHATIPTEHVPDRLVLINPELFTVHKLLEGVRRKLNVTSIYGVQFLSDDAETRSECKSKAAMALISSYAEVRAALVKVAEAEGVEMVEPKTLQILRLDEQGIDVVINKAEVRPRMLVLGGTLPEAEQKMLGMPEGWEREVLHRYTFVPFKCAKAVDLGTRPVTPMSLDLNGKLGWAWLLCHDGRAQLTVEEPIESLTSGSSMALLKHWARVLKAHGVLEADADIPWASAVSMDLPFAGALAHEGVANRTLLVGPPGGFYSATGEDIYPNAWSAIHAADVAKKALKETHLQDALQPYRHKWRTTLGDYLRGPQQNLRFLLPLVYRNQIMTNRLAESILLGKSVVR